MSLFTGAIASGLIGAAVSGGAALGSAALQSHAAGKAADAQTKAAQEALDFAKAQKAKQEAAYAPFGALGQQAVGMLPGLARQAPVGGPPAPYTTQPRATAPMPQVNAQGAPMSMMGGAGAMAPAMGGQMAPGQMQQPMVTLAAPDGSQKQVPASQAPYFISRGAKQVG